MKDRQIDKTDRQTIIDTHLDAGVHGLHLAS